MSFKKKPRQYQKQSDHHFRKDDGLESERRALLEAIQPEQSDGRVGQQKNPKPEKYRKSVHRRKDTRRDEPISISNPGRAGETDLLIIGAGAAGLMAAVTAGEMNLRVILVERKHLPGRKLLMCGNARCNLTNNKSAAEMIEAYGEPVGPFLRAALTAFPPSRFRAWLSERELTTVVHQDGRVYPSSEKAADVLHFFNDRLRLLQVPILLNAPVEHLEQGADGWRAILRNGALTAHTVLLATGGVSYPKTGSVGDGQKMAGALGHKILPFRPGLVGFEVEETWLYEHPDEGIPDVEIKIFDEHNRCAGTTRGELRCERWGITGPAIVNASRLVARQNLTARRFEVDVLPGLSEGALRARLDGATRGGSHALARLLAECGVSPGLGRALADRLQRESPRHWVLHPVRPRSLKEAMVTVGGVDLSEVDPSTMESKRCPGLYFAGEVLDVDGPTGGYNLHAAFSTARLAVQSAASGVRRGTCL